MADTHSYYSGLLTTIDSKISGLVSNPQVSYRVGNVSVSASDKLKQLMELRETIIKRISEKPAESFETLQSDFSVFGEDLNTYVDGTP